MTKICTNKECVHAGIKQPIENFHKGGLPGERKGVCKHCCKVQRGKNRAQKESAWMNMFISDSNALR